MHFNRDIVTAVMVRHIYKIVGMTDTRMGELTVKKKQGFDDDTFVRTAAAAVPVMVDLVGTDSDDLLFDIMKTVNNTMMYVVSTYAGLAYGYDMDPETEIIGPDTKLVLLKDIVNELMYMYIDTFEYVTDTEDDGD